MSKIGRHYRKLVSDAEIGQIRDTACAILCDYGFGIANRFILEKAEEKGFAVDYGAMRVAVKPEQFAALEACARRTAPPPKAEGEILRKPPRGGMSIGRNIVKIHDWGRGERRLAVLEDNRDFAKAAQAIDKIARVGPIYSSSDVPAVIEPIVGVAETLKLSDKPFSWIEMIMAEQLPYLEELETIAAGHEVRYRNSFASITRFTLDERAAACLEAVSRRNGLQRWGTNSCPFAGLNAPVTVAGSVAMAMAEIMGGWLAGWALNDDVEFELIPVSASMDMRTTRSLFGSQQAILMDSLLFQVFDELYGLDSHPEVSMTYTDGKIPGFQAIAGRIEKSLAMFALTGCDVSVHFGMLEAGSAISPAQLMLDLELNEELGRLVQGVRITPETLALEELLRLGPDGSYLDSDHTMANFMAESPVSRIFDGLPCGEQGEELLRQNISVDEAQSRYDEALRSYEPPAKSDEYLRAIDAVVEQAREKLLA